MMSSDTPVLSPSSSPNDFIFWLNSFKSHLKYLAPNLVNYLDENKPLPNEPIDPKKFDSFHAFTIAHQQWSNEVHKIKSDKFLVYHKLMQATKEIPDIEVICGEILPGDCKKLYDMLCKRFGYGSVASLIDVANIFKSISKIKLTSSTDTIEIMLSRLDAEVAVLDSMKMAFPLMDAFKLFRLLSTVSSDVVEFINGCCLCKHDWTFDDLKAAVITREVSKRDADSSNNLVQEDDENGNENGGERNGGKAQGDEESVENSKENIGEEDDDDEDTVDYAGQHRVGTRKRHTQHHNKSKRKLSRRERTEEYAQNKRYRIHGIVAQNESYRPKKQYKVNVRHPRAQPHPRPRHRNRQRVTAEPVSSALASTGPAVAVPIPVSACASSTYSGQSAAGNRAWSGIQCSYCHQIGHVIGDCAVLVMKKQQCKTENVEPGSRSRAAQSLGSGWESDSAHSHSQSHLTYRNW